jgi:transposase
MNNQYINNVIGRCGFRGCGFRGLLHLFADTVMIPLFLGFINGVWRQAAHVSETCEASS